MEQADEVTTGLQAPARKPESSGLSALMMDIALVPVCLLVALWLSAQPLVWDLLGAAPRTAAVWDRNETALVIFQTFSIPIALHGLGQYRLVKDIVPQWSYNRVLLALATSFGALLAILFVLGIQGVPRLPLFLDFVVLLVALTAWRSAYRQRTMRQLDRGHGARNALLVGPGTERLGRTFVQELTGRRIVGFVGGHIGAAPTGRGAWSAEGVLEDVVRMNSLEQPQHLWVDLPDHDRSSIIDGLGVEELYLDARLPPEDVQGWIRLAQARGLDVHLVPGQQAESGIAPAPWMLGEHVLLDVHRRPISRLGWLVKRGMDVLGAAFGLLAFAPAVFIAAIAIKVESPRLPIFYRSPRAGLKGRTFMMWKLTTMWPNAQEIEKTLAGNEREGPWTKFDSAADPRLTKVGRVLRKFTINEAPQFWNVLKGDMSLVGPRPPLPSEVATYMEYDFRYFRCLDVKPGMTGLWQVTAKDDPSFDRRIELDLQYMLEWSVWKDMRIVVKTVRVAVFGGE